MDPVTVTRVMPADATAEQLRLATEELMVELATQGGDRTVAWSWLQVQEDGGQLLTVSDGPDPLA